ncbi:VanZ family protein [Solibacillus sp. FSL K6-1523]|uniref:VanZ family protein n=1 Tax=Solibacillus sp. FSL K6-1523 TaxID=2921471 RepID=UPI0030F634FB
MKKGILLTISALFIVFYASNMTYEQQTVVPELRVLLKDKPLEDALSTLEIPYWGTIISIESRGYFYFIEFLIRKATHFIGYGILSIIFYFLYVKLKWRYPSILSFVTIFMIACLDEYRQSLIPGRTGIFDDVLIDAAGALFFLLLVKIIVSIKRFITKKAGHILK